MSTAPLLTPKVRLTMLLKTPEQKAAFQQITRKLGLLDKQFLTNEDLVAIVGQAGTDMTELLLGALPELQRYFEETLPAELMAAVGDDEAAAEALGMALIAALEETARDRPR